MDNKQSAETHRAQRVPALDLLRFMAACGVVLYHFTSHRPADDGSLSLGAYLTQPGYLGVDVFFMISGFVILWSARGRSSAEFVKARILRLYPEFWLALGLSALVFFLVPGGVPGPASAAQLAANATMVPGYLGVPMVDGVYWTLGVEIKFYAIVWALVFTRLIRWLEPILYAWLSVTALQAFVDLGGIARSLTLYPHGAHFAAGGLFYLVFESGWTRIRTTALAAALALCSYASITQMGGFMDAARVTPTTQAVTALVIFSAFVFFAFLPKLQAVTWPKWVGLAGMLTYPLYLTHNVAKELLMHREIPLPRWTQEIIAIAFALALAWGVTWTARRFVTPALKYLLNGFQRRATSVRAASNSSARSS